jgi:hypothetical protein
VLYKDSSADYCVKFVEQSRFESVAQTNITEKSGDDFDARLSSVCRCYQVLRPERSY